jgi:tetratricopeptide (TPR) repeat protein
MLQRMTALVLLGFGIGGCAASSSMPRGAPASSASLPRASASAPASPASLPGAAASASASPPPPGSAGSSGSPAMAHGAGHQGAPAPPALLEGLGTYHRPVTTQVPAAQAFFDQGLRLLYGFNHLEAQRAFEEAARLDPGCAPCYWGIALSHGSNYNSPTDADRERAARAAVRRAQAVAGGATPVEQALIAALARRHEDDPGADRARLDRAYADAMREVSRRFPDDPEAGTMFADALMNLRPWNLWKPDGTPQPETPEILATLERVIAGHPRHPGALHLYIHAVEGGPDPARGARAADALRGLMPAAGHLVHMPSHIYFRIGRYADAHAVNVRAAEADRRYLAARPASDIYRYGYYPHNLDFVWQSAAMEGRSAETIRAAREFAAAVPVEVVRQVPDMEFAPAAPFFALARFGRWTEILTAPPPPADLPYVSGAWRYARGLAFAATGHPAEARRELGALQRLADETSADRPIAQFFKTRELLALASDTLAGELALRRGDTETAVRHLLRAVATQDGHWFTEPPPWYYPVRQSLGAALLAGGRAVEAEAVYRDDLRRNPENGWSLYGLAQSLRAQGKGADAAVVETRFQRAWAQADVALTGSRF